ncbi:hypothetical protein Cgig2_022441 [Carnegiea gigantea]|uniref:mRNA-decapping enzyme-like protein n=1 Tax=Carnegiea gigantea TaxID=171969 RepID=A0A9Q1QEY9_9CARY|nr:hypothetical protein Cgig2_022441 [Carnegiea gigantea]
MNRRNTENLVENLLGDFEYEIQVPYLLYRNAAQEVNGIWFYNARECEEVANLFDRILNAYSKVPSKSKVSSSKSEFEELEAVPTMAVMDGPLEPSPPTTTNVNCASDEHTFVNFFSSAMTIANPSVLTITEDQYKPSATATLTSCPANIHQISPSPQIESSTSASLLSLLDTSESSGKNNTVTNLVKPSSFFSLASSSSPLVTAPAASSIPTAPPLQPPSNLQRPYGAPVLQPFPPPTPPPSLTPTSSAIPNYGPVISREKVRDALLSLVQDNQLIDMVYRALLNAHQS